MGDRTDLYNQYVVRIARLGCGSGIRSGGTRGFGNGVQLLLRGGLDEAEDTGHFTLECGEFEVDDGSARVKDDIDRSAERGEVAADSLAHAAFDAISIDGLAHGLTYGESDAGAGYICVAQWHAV